MANVTNVDIDPVCGMEVKLPSDISLRDNGQTYSFCSLECKNRFESEPDKYLAKKNDDNYRSHPGYKHNANITTETRKKADPEAANYVCPMHPDVISDKPGICSRCGMKLQKVTSESEHH